MNILYMISALWEYIYDIGIVAYMKAATGQNAVYVLWALHYEMLNRCHQVLSAYSFTICKSGRNCVCSLYLPVLQAASDPKQPLWLRHIDECLAELLCACDVLFVFEWWNGVDDEVCVKREDCFLNRREHLTI